MGRRAGTHNSPVESAMEKYYNDIGSRLSGVFVQQTSSELCQDFCQLTLDSRHRNSLKTKRSETPENTQRTCKPTPGGTPTHKSSSSGVSTSSSTQSEHESGTKDKTRLVDKLTRALFQKKHMCARCQRRSRSCLPNKNFTHREKHYTCAACRQQSHAVKNLFGQSASKLSSSHSGNKQSLPTNGSTETALQSKERPPHRTQNTDSGYDTVTSCSTMSSACSAFTNTMNSSNGNPQQSNYTTHVSKANIPDVADSSDISNTTRSQHVHNKGAAQDGPLHGASIQMELRHFQTYDGYLPDVDYERLERCQAAHVDAVRVMTPLQDVTNFEGRTFHNDQVIEETMMKACYTCSATNKTCFRLPWEGGWLCEDCLDRVH